MKVVAICNHKGGTGKTTSVIHLAAALGLSGYRTLVVDLDPQGFLTRMLGVGEPPEGASSLALFDPEARLETLPMQEMRNFDLLPASSALTKRMRSLTKPTDVLWAREAAQAGWPYDLLLFDTAAAVTPYSLNALVASQHLVVPVTPEYQPVVGAEQTFQTASLVQKKLNPALSAPLFLFTQVDARKRAHRRYREYMRTKYEPHVMQSIIRTCAALARSERDGTTVFDSDPHARGVRDYANATDELLRRVAAGEAPSEASEGPADDASTDGSDAAAPGSASGDGTPAPASDQPTPAYPVSS